MAAAANTNAAKKAVLTDVSSQSPEPAEAGAFRPFYLHCAWNGESYSARRPVRRFRITALGRGTDLRANGLSGRTFDRTVVMFAPLTKPRGMATLFSD